MLRNEQILLLREMKNAKVYAEWGCGGYRELACGLPHWEKLLLLILDCIDFLVFLKPKEGLDFQLIEAEFQKYSKKFD
jgi:hypothetical protein